MLHSLARDIEEFRPTPLVPRMQRFSTLLLKATCSIIENIAY